MNITLKQIEAFYWTAMLGSFSAASSHLHTTQSAISKRVAELESALATTLFDRSQKMPALTSKGRALVGHAEEMLELTSNTISAVQGEDFFSGRICIGVTELCALTWLPRFIAVLRERHPRLVVEPNVDAGRNLFDQLEDNSLDLVVLPGDKHWNKRYRAIFATTVKIAWMASPLLNVPARTLPANKLSEYPLLMQSTSSAVSRRYDDWLESNGVSPKRALRTTSLPVLGQLTLAGLGISALPLEYYQAEVLARRLQVVKTRPTTPPVDYYIVHRAEAADRGIDEIAKLVKASCNFARSA
ncbi:LysR family transcriptional regulator [Paraburkholderia fungorum]|uniref:HTH lysR-type domain-containing protein n=1 Tax=Paraburkholderia fungorum TaxID=134537 RepID=A0A420FNE5_9BURK|nr:LysR family transcriptional regulator [Paraburkholderia fungorum]RKF34437.1 hypothetical protein BCY88_38215 [Paraburkholderia fungorum]